MYGYFLLLIIVCFLRPVESTAAKYTCLFRNGYGVGRTESRIGNQTGNDCVEACWNMKKYDDSINGVTIRSSSQSGCWCYKKLYMVIPSFGDKTCYLLHVSDIKFHIVQGWIPSGWRRATTAEVKRYRGSASRIIMDNTNAVISLPDGCIWKTLTDFSVRNAKCDYASSRLIVKIPRCSSVEESSCHTQATCSKTLSNFKCTCNSGFEGNGQSCRDIDECNQVHISNNCPRCRNTVGSYHCRCNTGYYWDGDICTDIDECAKTGLQVNKCHYFATCQNLLGSYLCHCDDGYVGDGYSCTMEMERSESVNNVVVVVIVVFAIIVIIIAAIVITNRRRRQQRLKRDLEIRAQDLERTAAAERMADREGDAESHAIAELAAAERDAVADGRGEIPVMPPISYGATSPSAPSINDTVPEPEGCPKDSDITGLSVGPPEYRGIFSTGYNPVPLDENLPPPPTYDEAMRT